MRYPSIKFLIVFLSLWALVPLGIVAGFGLVAGEQHRSSLNEMTRASQAALSYAKTADTAQRMKNHALQYAMTGASSSVEGFNGLEVELMRELKNIQQLEQANDRGHPATILGDLAQRFSLEFGKLVEKREQKKIALSEILEKEGKIIRAATERLKIDALKNQVPELIAVVDTFAVQYGEAESGIRRFADAPSDAAVAELKALFRKTFKTARQISKTAIEPMYRDSAKSIAGGVRTALKALPDFTDRALEYQKGLTNDLPLALKAFAEASDRMAGTRSAVLTQVSEASIEDGEFQVLRIGIVVLIGALLSLAVGGLTVLRTVPAFRLLSRVMAQLAEGNTMARTGMDKRSDEIGQMARALDVFRDNAIERTRLEEEERGRQAARQERAVAVDHQVANFETAFSAVQSTVEMAIAKLDGASNDMSAVAQGSGELAESVDGYSTAAADSVQSVARSTIALEASIQEISTQLSKSKSIADDATRLASGAKDEMSALVEMTSRIDTIVNLINEIADQTNLLALNATIEAARAGESGRGFAVVAAEVRTLAGQTSDAANQIAGQIRTLQSVCGEANGEIVRVTETISQLYSVATRAASAVDEQSISTSKISRDAQDAARSMDNMSTAVKKVTVAAGSTSQAADAVRLASQNISAQSDQLDNTARSFLENLRKLG